MPFDQLVPNVAPQDDMVLYWPPNFETNGFQVGTAWEVQASTRGQAANSVSLWAAPVGGGFASDMQLYNGMAVGRLRNNGAGLNRRTRTSNFFRPVIITETTGLPNLGTAAAYPRNWRVLRVAWLMRISNANPVGGLMIQCTQAADVSQGGWGFGVMGDGAGNWRWYTNRTGVAGNVTEAVALALAAPTQMNLFEIEVIGAVGAAANAVCNLYVNDVAVLSRSFTPAGVLPLYTDGLANCCGYAVGVDSDDGATLVLDAEIQFGPMTFILSKYTKAGLEVIGPGG